MSVPSAATPEHLSAIVLASSSASSMVKSRRLSHTMSPLGGSPGSQVCDRRSHSTRASSGQAMPLWNGPPYCITLENGYSE